MNHRILLSTILLLLAHHATCKSLQPIIREQHRIQERSLPENRQLGVGLSALGTLVSPLLFLMGMGSFISMLPQMFQTVMSGVGSNLIQSFTGAGAAGGTGSSTRLRRDITDEEMLYRLGQMFSDAVIKYEGQRVV